MNTRNEDGDGLRRDAQCVVPVKASRYASRPTGPQISIALAFIVAAIGQPACAIDITDQRSRTVAFEKLPQRVVFLPIPGPATFMAVDGSERKIVGMNAHSASAMREGILGKMFPGFAQIATNVVMGASDPSNFNPNVESILALPPRKLVSGQTSHSSGWHLFSATTRNWSVAKSSSHPATRSEPDLASTTSEPPRSARSMILLAARTRRIRIDAVRDDEQL